MRIQHKQHLQPEKLHIHQLYLQNETKCAHQFLHLSLKLQNENGCTYQVYILVSKFVSVLLKTRQSLEIISSDQYFT